MLQNGLRPAVVITGASNGIGQAMARTAAVRGQPIVLIGRSEERLAAVADPLGNGRQHVAAGWQVERVAA